MAENAVQMGEHITTWWRWFGLALFLLVPFDLLTTLLAVTKYGASVEVNPIVQSLLGEGLYVVTAVHVIVVGLVVFLFHAAMESVRHAPPSYHRTLTHVVNTWIGILLVAGIVLAVNNLLALV